MKPYQKAHGPC